MTKKRKYEHENLIEDGKRLCGSWIVSGDSLCEQTVTTRSTQDSMPNATPTPRPNHISTNAKLILTLFQQLHPFTIDDTFMSSAYVERIEWSW